MREYALYRGDKFVTIGTIKQIAEETGTKEETIRFYRSPAYARRRGDNADGMFLIEIDEEDDNEIS
jgi:hypothetical protein